MTEGPVTQNPVIQNNVEIRPFSEADWQLYKTVRLKALETDPYVFSASFAEAKTRPDEKWRHDLANPDTVIFGVFHGGNVVGMTAVSIDCGDAERKTAKLWGSWLAPEWRRKGVSRRMYEVRLDWAKAHPTVRRVTVSHRKSNAVSKRANQRCGFVFTHAADAVWHNNQKETEFFYELVVKPGKA